MSGTTPLQIADALEGVGRDALQSVNDLRKQTPSANVVEFRKTLVDCEALGWLALYYAEKVRAACDLGLYDQSRDASEQSSTVRHLEAALDAWKHYASVRDGQYLPGPRMAAWAMWTSPNSPATSRPTSNSPAPGSPPH